MRFHTLLLISFSRLAFTSPTPIPQGVGQGADSCDTDPLSPETWNKLKIDDFLATAAKNYTRTKTNNVQSLADSFGAPNFFCGLDQFCNAGQPCLPIKLPAWYATIAIQNWNNYMNALNTALTFSASILTPTLGALVADLFPDPKDNITPIKNLGLIFSSVLKMVPLVGPLGLAKDGAATGLTFFFTTLKPPAPTDKFLTWSNIATSVNEVVRDYQAALSSTIRATLDAEIDNPEMGISAMIKGGSFLGVTQNFTQTELQDKMIEAVSMNAIGLALQAQKIFVARFLNRTECSKEFAANELCKKNEGSETFTLWALLRRGSKSKVVPQVDVAKALLEKHGMTPEVLLKGPAECYDANEKRQLTNVFEQVEWPGDAKAPCVYNVLVCDVTAGATKDKDVIDYCAKTQGLDV